MNKYVKFAGKVFTAREFYNTVFLAGLGITAVGGLLMQISLTSGIAFCCAGIIVMVVGSVKG